MDSAEVPDVTGTREAESRGKEQGKPRGGTQKNKRYSLESVVASLRRAAEAEKGFDLPQRVSPRGLWLESRRGLSYPAALNPPHWLGKGPTEGDTVRNIPNTEQGRDNGGNGKRRCK